MWTCRSTIEMHLLRWQCKHTVFVDEMLLCYWVPVSVKQSHAQCTSYYELNMPVSFICWSWKPPCWHNFKAPYLISENVFQTIIKYSCLTDMDIHRTIWSNHRGSNVTCRIVSEDTQNSIVFECACSFIQVIIQQCWSVLTTVKVVLFPYMPVVGL